MTSPSPRESSHPLPSPMEFASLSPSRAAMWSSAQDDSRQQRLQQTIHRGFDDSVRPWSDIDAILDRHLKEIDTSVWEGEGRWGLGVERLSPSLSSGEGRSNATDNISGVRPGLNNSTDGVGGLKPAYTTNQRFNSYNNNFSGLKTAMPTGLDGVVSAVLPTSRDNNISGVKQAFTMDQFQSRSFTAHDNLGGLRPVSGIRMTLPTSIDNVVGLKPAFTTDSSGNQSRNTSADNFSGIRTTLPTSIDNVVGLKPAFTTDSSGNQSRNTSADNFSGIRTTVPSSIDNVVGLKPAFTTAPLDLRTANAGRTSNPALTNAPSPNELQHQLTQLTLANRSLQQRVNSDQQTILNLQSAQEDARREAALWEARWRDDFGTDPPLLEELRGALLQESEREYRELRERLAARDGGEGGLENDRLMEELKRCRELLAQRDTSQGDGEHHPNISMVDRGTDASPFEDHDIDAALAQLTQENLTLHEENASVSAENERLAKRCVELEHCADTVKMTLRRAESRVVELEREKGNLEGRIRRMERDVAGLSSEREDARRAADRARTDGDTLLQRVRSAEVEKEQVEKELLSVRRENEMLRAQKMSLDEYHINAQEELRSWQIAKEELESELAAKSEENASLSMSNLSMKERLEERQALLDTLRNGDVDGPQAEENRILRSSLSGMEHQLRDLESALAFERRTLASTEHARELAEEKIGVLENRVKSLEGEITVSNGRASNERKDHLRLEQSVEELKATILSLRGEISSAAISQSQLELELKQREEECCTLRTRLEPLQKEKYRLEIDNATLSDEIHNLRNRTIQSVEDIEEATTPQQLVVRLEEKNDALAKSIHSIQMDMQAIHSRTNSLDQPPTDPTVDNLSAKSKSRRSGPSIPQHMEHMNRARSAVKETASLLRTQREKQSNGVSITAHSSTVITPSRTEASHSKSPIPTASPPISAHQSIDGLRQLEEEHTAETTALKSKYRERIRCMKKEWEGERRAILGLAAGGPGLERIKTPGSRSRSTFSMRVGSGDTGGTCETDTIESSFLETEAFVMNILNELDAER